MKRALIVPAAGRGTRLGSDIPKALYLVAGRAMIDRLFDLYDAVVDRFVLVVSPAFEPDIRRHCERLGERVAIALQHAPNGMLPAILEAGPLIEREHPESVWISWCDQIAIHPDTIRGMVDLTANNPGADLVFPTVQKTDPYIHFDRDERGRITAVRHKREADAMPETGEGDSGLFALSFHAYSHHLTNFFAEDASAGSGTKEVNFLPFIPWMAARGTVITFPVRDQMESLGVNTPTDAGQIEHYLQHRA